MKTLVRACLAVALLSQGACAGLTPMPVGLIFTDVDTNKQVTMNKLGSKSGESCATTILGLVAWGDASAATAAKAGAVTTIASVDHNFFNVLGIVQKLCTHVTGE